MAVKMKKHLGVIKKAFGLIWKIDKLFPLLQLVRSLATVAFPLYLSFCVSFLINELAGPKRTGHVALLLLLLSTGVLVCKPIVALLEWECSCRYMRIQDAFICQNSEKAMRMEYMATEDREILEMYTHAWRSNTAAGTIQEKVFSLLGYGVQLAGCIGIVLGLGAGLTLALLASVALYFVLDYRIGQRERRCALDTVADVRMADYNRECMGDVAYAKDVRLYYPVSFFLERLRLFQGRRLGRERKKEYYCGRMQTLQALLLFIQTLVLYGVLIRRFIGGAIPIGYFSLAVSSITIFMGAAGEISTAWSEVVKNELYLENLDRFRNLPERDRAVSQAPEVMETVEFEHVWFRYPGREEYALADINLVLRGREILTIVGENGSGKTTFVKLLLGLYRPTRGRILLNGRELDSYPEGTYRRFFAPVFQDYRLFAYRIRENLCFDNPYDGPKAERLMEEFSIADKIRSLPLGVEQYVGKGYEESGVSFSGGESQKLAIIRALLKEEARCLVLDEPTAALDPLAEMELYQKIRQLSGEKACVFITHRLAGIRFADRILYFKGGRIVEEGSCQALLERRGYFYDFYQIQAKLYRN